MKNSLSCFEVYKEIYTPYNLEKIMVARLRIGMTIEEIREASEYFYSVGKLNRNERNWFCNTDIETLKECYL